MLQTIYTFKDIDNSVIDQNTLVLIDIDDTVFRSCSYWGSGKHFGTMGNEKIQLGYTPSQAKVKIYPRWIQSQSEVLTNLVDDSFHTFLDNAKQQAFLTIGYTARRPTIAAATQKQLHQNNIQFSNIPGFSFNKNYVKSLHPNPKPPIQLDRHYECETLFTNGVLYCHELNSKGEVFYDFYQTLNLFCKENQIPFPTKVLFVDDGMHNIKALIDPCNKLNLKYFGMHFDVGDYLYDKKVACRDEKLYLISGKNLSRSKSFYTENKSRATNLSNLKRHSSFNEKEFSSLIEKSESNSRNKMNK